MSNCFEALNKQVPLKVWLSLISSIQLQAGGITTGRMRGNREWVGLEKDKKQTLSSWSHSDPSRGISSALTNPTGRHVEFLCGREHRLTGTGGQRCRESTCSWKGREYAGSHMKARATWDTPTERAEAVCALSWFLCLKPCYVVNIELNGII